MNWPPGWSSIESAAWWSTAWFWAGIVSLLMLGICEVVSHRYSQRKDELADAHQRTLQRQHDTDIAELQLQAANANEQAANANERAANAQVELEKYKAPRTIPEPQWATFIAAIQPSSGQEYIPSVASGTEPDNLVCLIDNLLKEAGWKRFDHPMGITVGTNCGPMRLNTLSDIHVRVAQQPTNKTTEAAERLANALHATGLATFLERDPVNVPNDHVVLIMVGTKL